MTQYTVQPGDTPYEIAQRHGLSLEQLYGMNPGLQNHVYDLQIGTVLNTSHGHHQSPPMTPPNCGNNDNFGNNNNGGYPQQNVVVEERKEEESIWNSTGMHVAEGVIGTAAVVGLGALAMGEWKKQSKHNAQSNAPAFSQYQSSAGPLFWRPVQPGQQSPQDAIQLGRDGDGTPLYAARASVWGGWHVGKANGRGDVYISYGGKEEKIRGAYEMLCGNPRGISVIPQSGAINLQQLPSQPIDAGHEANGDRLYVAIADHQGSVQVGKCSASNQSGCNFPYGGKEVAYKSYRVVVIV
ncbi:hypothetical protein HDU98_000858 [Podochytrium sp. JEL0797]|nr:hypothetical protein HDU98_000858 [Podochytrium sp. JEL0797]